MFYTVNLDIFWTMVKSELLIVVPQLWSKKTACKINILQTIDAIIQSYSFIYLFFFWLYFFFKFTDI